MWACSSLVFNILDCQPKYNMKYGGILKLQMSVYFKQDWKPAIVNNDAFDLYLLHNLFLSDKPLKPSHPLRLPTTSLLEHFIAK